MGTENLIEAAWVAVEKHRSDWAGDYNGETCKNCGRERVMRCNNGKRLCEKCRWSPEDKAYISEE